MKVLVIGASLKEKRYSNKAIKMLNNFKYEVYAIGLLKGKIGKTEIVNEKLSIENIHTITLYLNAVRQKDYYDYLVKLKPKRVIFNPGTENKEFENLLKDSNIACEFSCTLVLLQSNLF